ncbi:MAG: holdfast anchoring protein HfaB [Pseudomonadota bacterium]|nr:holdfast anchoring protein HfaB [Pseudomonadota bacterium]
MSPIALRAAALVIAAGLGLTPGLASAETRQNYVPPIGDAPVTSNPTPYTPALTCLAERAAGRPAPRISVGRISDLTGRVDFDTGAKIPQGAALFAITALGKAGVPVVERLDNSVAEIELNYARQHLLSDTPERAGSDPQNFRPIYAGQIAGSQYYIVGGVTELNYNIASSGLKATVGEAAAAGVRGTASTTGYVMNVAVDLRLVDTRTQQVIDMASFQKQVTGRDASLGVVGTVGDYGANLNGGRGAMEPLQAAVRTLVERGVFQLIATLQGGNATADCLNPAANPSGPTLPTYAALPGS